MQNFDEAVYWLALRMLPRLGPVGLRRKWKEVGDIRLLWEELGAPQSMAQACLDSACFELEKVASFGAQVLTLSHSAYPLLLQDIPDISPILYIKGQLKPDDIQTVGIVGSRHPSHYGIEVTQRLTHQLVDAGYTIVSGMAKGVDAVAHRTAIELGGRTIAVWGSGLDCVYPPEHKDLAEQVLDQGVLMSQFPLGTQAQSFTFPARNKIIAGLSRVVIVTEARAKSGSLLTAEAGLRYGRQVGAVPGSIHYLGSVGPHQLIQNGARLVVDAADIVDTMVAANAPQHQNHPTAIPVTASEKALLDQLQSGPQHIDELIRGAARPAAEVVSSLSMLEIKGLVKQLAMGEYLKN